MKTIYKITSIDGSSLNRQGELAVEQVAKKSLGGSKSCLKNRARVSLGEFTDSFLDRLEDELGDVTAVVVNVENEEDGVVRGAALIYAESEVSVSNTFTMPSQDFGNLSKRLFSRSFKHSYRMVEQGF